MRNNALIVDIASEDEGKKSKVAYIEPMRYSVCQGMANRDCATVDAHPNPVVF